MTMSIKPLEPLIVTNEAETLAESIVIPRAEEAQVLVRPGTIGPLWVEREYGALEHEQPDLWEASGIAASRETAVTAARQTLVAGEVERVVSEHRQAVSDAHEHLLLTHRVLAPFRRRAKGAKRWYQAAKAGFLAGDIAGFGTAAIWLGELPVIALTLATSAAVATVAAGLLGVDVRDQELRRQREHAVPTPAEEQNRFPQLFRQPPPGGTLKRMLLLAAGTAGMIGFGIAALRAAVDDQMIGFIFGGIAMAVAGGCFLVSYAGADEAADLIEHAEADYKIAVARHLCLTEHRGHSQFEEAQAESVSLAQEHQARGRAATHRVQALKWGILRRNPSHAGHGAAAPQAGAPVGQTARRREEAA